MAQWDFDLEHVRRTASDFTQKAAAYEKLLQFLEDAVEKYNTGTTTERAKQMRNEWETVHKEIQPVKKFLDDMGEHLNKGAKALEDQFAASK